MVNKYTYLEVFLEEIDKKLSLSEFEELYKKPHQTIKRHLIQLLNDKILLMEKKNKFLFYKLNMKNILVYEYLSIAEKQRLFKFLENPLFNRLYLVLEGYFKNSSILIFGSSVNQLNYSDIDLLIITEEIDRGKIKNEIKNFETIYSVKIHPIISNQIDIDKSFIDEIIKSHIILNNHDYYVRLFYGKK